MLLAVVLFGTLGLMAELVLLEHTESLWQWAPLVVLGGGALSGAAVAIRPTRRAVRAFQSAMVLFVVTGVLGVALHLTGNMEFELEMEASLGGLALLWRSLRGATPALAPGALVQLGLLGLIQAYHHPALKTRTGTRHARRAFAG